MTHATRIRLFTFCLAVLPAGIVFSLLLLFPLAALSQTPSFSTHSSFTAPVNSPSNVPNPVVLHGDLNNDGYEDLIINTNTSSRVFLSKGTGAYTEVSATINADPWVLGDFNGDGKLDLIAGNKMYFGKGDGTFRDAGAITLLPGGFIGLTAADVNHDGKLDLVVLTGDGNLQALFGNGDGSFTAAGPETPLGNFYGTGQFLIGDFNGDGNIDVAYAAITPFEDNNSTVEVYTGDGTGNFSIYYEDVNQSMLNLIAADVNGDGISDLIGTQVLYDQGVPYFLDELQVYYGTSNDNSSGELSNMISGGIGLSNFGMGQVAVADFNGDGIPDVAVFENACNDVLDCTLTTNATLHVVSSVGDLPVSSLQSNPGLPFALRANRDTRADLVYTNASTSNSTTFFTLLNTTTGNFPTCDAPNTAVGIAQCSPSADSVSSPVNFAIGAAGDEPLRKIDVWVDRKKQFEQFAGAFSNYAFLNASLPIAAGSHRVNVIAYGWDNSQVSKLSTLDVKESSCSVPTSAGVHICSPASGSTVDSPVKVEATAKVTGTIVSTQLWVDGIKTYNSPGSTTLTTSVSLDAGTHRFAVIATSTAGQKWESTVDATVK